MNDARKLFSLGAVLCLVIAVVGIATMTIMEYQARQALPPEEQTVEAIASLYDGAVCLWCDISRIWFAMFGFASVTAVLFGWGIYEAIRGIWERSSKKDFVTR